MLKDEQIKKLWPSIKTGLRNLWGGLNDEDLEASKGDFSVIGKLVEKEFGESQEDVKRKIGQLLSSFDNDTDKGQDPDISSYQRSPIDGDRDAVTS